MKISINRFKGEVPLIDPAASPSALAAEAVNCGFRRGGLGGVMFDLVPRDVTWLKPDVIGADVRPRSLHYSHMADAWFIWSSDAVDSLVDSPVAPLDTYKRLYFADETGPRYMARSQYTDGVVNRNRASYRLGVPAPEQAPQAALDSETIDDDIDDAAVTRELVYYIATLVDDFGQEGPPSAPSSNNVKIPTEYDFQVSVSLSLGDVDYNARPFSTGQAKVRFYRLTSGSSAADYQYVGEVDWATTVSFTDTVAYGEEQEVIPGEDWFPPPAEIKQIVGMDNNFLAGIHGSMVCYSEVRLPHAWPTDYRFSLPYRAVAIASCQGGLFIGTTGEPHWASGTDPSSAVPIRLDYNFPCLGSQGVAVVQGTVVYPSWQGLVACDGSRAQLLTSDLFSEEQWSDLDPETMIGWEYDGRYFFYSRTADVLYALEPMSTESLTRIDTEVNDSLGDLTCVGRDTRHNRTVLGFYSGDVELASVENVFSGHVRWRSNELVSPSVFSLSTGLIESRVWPVTLRLIGNGEVYYTTEVSGQGVFRLPPLRHNRYQIELEFSADSASDVVTRAVVAQSVQEILGG